jgi:predicted DNA-binding protein with PD1-like motif
MAELRMKHALGSIGKTVALRLLPGTDLMSGIKKACEDNGIRGGAILTAIGSVRKLTVQVLVPNEKAKLGVAYNPPQTIPGPIEVLGIQGVIFETETGEIALHLHGTFCDQEGKTFAGHLVPEENPILATLDVVIGEVAGVRFMRRYDEETEINMFSPEPA